MKLDEALDVMKKATLRQENGALVLTPDEVNAAWKLIHAMSERAFLLNVIRAAIPHLHDAPEASESWIESVEFAIREIEAGA